MSKNKIKKVQEFKFDDNGNIYYRYVYKIRRSDIEFRINEEWWFYGNMYFC